MKIKLPPVQKTDKVLVKKIDKKLRKIFIRAEQMKIRHQQAYSVLMKYVLSKSKLVTLGKMKIAIISLLQNIEEQPKNIQQTAEELSKSQCKSRLYMAYFWDKLNERYSLWTKVGITVREGFKVVQVSLSSNSNQGDERSGD